MRPESSARPPRCRRCVRCGARPAVPVCGGPLVLCLWGGVRVYLFVPVCMCVLLWGCLFVLMCPHVRAWMCQCVFVPVLMCLDVQRDECASLDTCVSVFVCVDSYVPTWLWAFKVCSSLYEHAYLDVCMRGMYLSACVYLGRCVC